METEETEETTIYANVSAVGALNNNASRYAGGIVGHATGDALTISNSFAALVIKSDTGSGIAGGLVGKADGALTVTDSYADCYIQGGIIGGLAGECGDNSKFQNCYSAGFPLLPNPNTATAAGITTSGTNVTVNDCYSAFSFGYGSNNTILPSYRYAFTGDGGEVDGNSYYSYGDVNEQSNSDPDEHYRMLNKYYGESVEINENTTFYNLTGDMIEDDMIEDNDDDYDKFPLVVKKADSSAWTLPHYGDWMQAGDAVGSTVYGGNDENPPDENPSEENPSDTPSGGTGESGETGQGENTSDPSSNG